jgi:hypothetical protein
VSGGCEGVVIG